MMARAWRLLPAALALGVALTGCTFSGRPQNGPATDSSAPEIVGTDQDGKEFKLSDYHGKVVLLDFWFST